MCGVCGFASMRTNLDIRQAQDTVVGMACNLASRGPDESFNARPRDVLLNAVTFYSDLGAIAA
jgi:asparagine synthetase B (glutamine-hydrolysing)